MSLESLSKETGLPKPTVKRFLGTLQELGYVFKDEYDQYSCSLKMFSIGSRSLEFLDLTRIANPVIDELSQKLGETVHLGTRFDDECVYIIKKESRYTIRMHSRIGKRIPLYCTALGKIFLADDTEENLDRYFKHNDLMAFTPQTIVNQALLRRELEDIQARGFSHDRGEHDSESRCIAAAIRDHSNSVIAALSVSWPSFRFDDARLDEYQDHINSAVNTISVRLGHNIE